MEYIPVEVNPQNGIEESGIRELIQHVKSEWSNDVQFTALQGGFVNYTWLCTHNQEKIVVRIYNEMDLLPFVDRDYEAVFFHHLHTLKLVPKFYARFHNGLVYEYVNGEQLKPEQLQDEDIMTKIIEKMYRIHTSNAPKKSTYSPTQPHSIFYHAITDVVNDLDIGRFDEETRGKFLALIPSMQHLQEEAATCKRNMEAIYRNFPHVPCHLDIKPQNILHDKEENKIEFLDFETTDYAPALQEFATLLDSEEKQTWRKWILTYFRLAQLPEEDVVIEKWMAGIRHSQALVYLSGCCWAFRNAPLADGEWKPERIRYATYCYSKYKEMKDNGELKAIEFDN